MFGRNRRMRQGGYNGNYGGGRFNGSGGLWKWVILVGVLFCGAIYAKHTGYLGHFKNKYMKTPKQQVAAMNGGIAQLHQVNNNVDKRIFSAEGHSELAQGAVNNQTLITGEFDDVNDLYNFGKVYSVFVFTGTKKDNPWLSQIREARKHGLTVRTISGETACEQGASQIKALYTHDLTCSRKSKNYGKVTGETYPVLILFQHGHASSFVVKQEQEKKLFSIQMKVQKKVDEKANNYEMPANGVGIPYPDYKKYIIDAGNAAKKAGKAGVSAVKQGEKQYKEHKKRQSSGPHVYGM